MVQESVQFLVDSTQAEAGAKKFEQAIDKAEKSVVDFDKELRDLDQSFARIGQGLDRIGNEMRQNNRLTAQTGESTKQLNRHLFEMRRASVEAARAQELLGRSSRTATSDLARLSTAAAQPARQFGSLIAPVTRLAAILGVGLGLRQAATSLASFERTLVNVGQVTNANEQQFRDLQETALRFGETTEFTATQAGEGLLFLGRAGFTAQQSIAALPASLNLATAAGLQLGEAADIASNVVSQFGLEVAQLNDVNDALVATSNNANTDVRQLAEALKFAGPLAGTLGVSLTQTVAALGAFGDRGVQASNAGTSLTAVFRELLKPSDDFRAAIEANGLSINDLNPALNDLATVGRRVGQVLNNLPEGVSVFDLARTEGARGLALLSSGADSVEKLVDKIGELRGVTDDAATALRDTLQGSFNGLASAAEGVLQRTGEDGLIGALRGIADFATETVRKIGGIKSATEEYGFASSAAAAATELFVAALAIQAGTSFLRFVGGAVSSLGELTTRLLSAERAQKSLSAAFALNPIGAIAVGVAAAVAAFRAFELQLEATRRAQRAFIDEADESRSVFRRISEAFNFSDPTATDSDRRLGELRSQLSGIETALSAVQRAGEPALDFRSAEDVTRRFEELQRRVEETGDRLKGTRDTLRQLQETGRGAFVETSIALLSDQAEQLTLDLQTAQTQLVQLLGGAGAIEIDGARFFSADFVRQAATATDQVKEFEAALRESAEVTGLGQTLIREGAALRILEEAAKRTRGSLADLGREQENSQDAAEGFAVALQELTQPLRAQQRDLEARRTLLDSVAAGERALVDARRELAIQEQVRNRSQAVEQALLSRNVRVTGEQRAEIEALARSYVELELSVSDYENELGRIDQAQESAFQSALDTADALQAQIDALNGIEPAASAVEAVIRDIEAAFGAGSAKADELSLELRKLQGSLSETQARAARREQEDAVRNVLGQVEDDIRRLGLTGDEARRFDARRVLEQRTGQPARGEDVDRLSDSFELLERAERASRQVDIAAGGLADASGNLVQALIDGTSSLSDAVQTFGQEIQQALIEGFVIEPVRQFAQQAARQLFSFLIPTPNANGNAFDRQGIVPFAGGGVFDSPTFFGFGGGRLGVLGERGPEAILPLERGRDGRLGVRSGGGGGSVSVSQRITINNQGGTSGDSLGMRRAAGVSGRALARSLARRAR